MCIPLAVPRQQLSKQHNNRRIVECVILYTVCVVSKDSLCILKFRGCATEAVVRMLQELPARKNMLASPVELKTKNL
jgi:hypothetical protein